MANDSYLYSVDALPVAGTDEKPLVVGIAEWNYDIPLAFRLLVSAHPRKCHSLIWEYPDEIAIAGDYVQGVARLLEYLDGMNQSGIAALRDEARAFLTADENKRRYFVLECGEIYEMDAEPLFDQNERLLSELLKFGSSIPKPDTAEDIHTLGLGNWSNVLYYDPNDV